MLRLTHKSSFVHIHRKAGSPKQSKDFSLSPHFCSFFETGFKESHVLEKDSNLNWLTRKNVQTLLEKFSNHI